MRWLPWRRRKINGEAKLAILEARRQRDDAHRQTPRVNQTARRGQAQAARAREFTQGMREAMVIRGEPT